jgi:mannose-1-phosphate guanylyltransferase
MKLKNTYAIVMAGGKGERFWPLSTAAKPKQFLSVVAGKALLALAIDRLHKVVPLRNVVVVTGASHVQATKEAVPDLPPANIIGEPMGRDTAAACAVGTAWAAAQSHGKDAVCLILTADQLIGDLPAFHDTLTEAATVARAEDVFVTLGIVPTAPSTGFGYIETGDAYAHPGAIPMHRVRRFVEKPDSATARAYVQSGRFFWNSGMFVWRASTFLDALRVHAPPLADLAEALSRIREPDRLHATLGEVYPALAKISVDYAIMEKVSNIVMARAAFAWDDVGAWPSLTSHLAADESGNAVVGRCEALDSRGNVVVSTDRVPSGPRPVRQAVGRATSDQGRIRGTPVKAHPAP